MTLVSRLEDVPAFDALFATWFKGAPATVEPREEGETEAPPDGGGSDELQPQLIAEGTGKRRQRPRAAPPPRLRRDRRGPGANCARRCASTSPRSARAAAARPAAATPSICAARCGPRPAPARSRQLARRDRPHRTRPLLVLIDVSGSLRPHVPDYLRFALGRAGRDVHVRHPPDPDHQQRCGERDVDTALANVSSVVEDADGGTRIGAALQEFLDTARYADRARGALTIVLSDGLERGDPALMAHAVRRLVAAEPPAAVVDAARPRSQPTTRHPRAWRRSLDDLDDLAGARDLPSLLDRVERL